MFEHSIQLIDFQDKKLCFLFNFYDKSHPYFSLIPSGPHTCVLRVDSKNISFTLWHKYKIR